MPNPKRRHSKSRTRKRRTHQGLGEIPLATCSHCGAIHFSHRVCPSCGYYGEEPIISPEEET